MEDYKIREKKIDDNYKRNKKFILEFEKWLKNKKLSPKTIRKHLSNIDIYINDYLNYYEITKMEDGISEAYMFLNDWFIRKCAFASITSITENAASIKKFYNCMCELGYISKDDYSFLNKSISDNMDIFYDSYNETYEYEGEEWEEFF